MQKRKNTIRDVAHQAGVSIATVSLVLKGDRLRYSPDTAQRVLNACTALHYRPNRNARNLARSRTHTLAFVTHKEYGLLTRSQWFAAVLDGALSVAVERDYDIKLVPLGAGDLPERKLEDGSVDGVLLAAPAEGSKVLHWASQGALPIVVVGRIMEDQTLCVGIDDFSGQYAAVKHLLGLGHRRIGFLNAQFVQQSAMLRERAYEQAMAEAGLPAPKEWRINSGWSESLGEEGARRLLQVQPRLTAIVCASDELAVGALRELQRQEVVVPQQMSLTGFDDEEKARRSNPPITSVRQPAPELGRAALELLLHQIEGRELAARKLLLPTELSLRGSVAPPPLSERL